MLQPAEIVTFESASPHLRHQYLRELARYWLDLRASSGLPRRKDIDPLDISPRILPHMWIVDCEDGGARFRFRLAGEAINQTFGYPVRGLSLDEAFPARLRGSVQKRFERVAQEACGCHCIGTVYVENERNGFGERLILPLSDNGRDVSHLLGVTHYAIGHGVDTTQVRGQVKETFFPVDALEHCCSDEAALKERPPQAV